MSFIAISVSKEEVVLGAKMGVSGFILNMENNCSSDFDEVL